MGSESEISEYDYSYGIETGADDNGNGYSSGSTSGNDNGNDKPKRGRGRPRKQRDDEEIQPVLEVQGTTPVTRGRKKTEKVLAADELAIMMEGLFSLIDSFRGNNGIWKKDKDLCMNVALPLNRYLQNLSPKMVKALESYSLPATILTNSVVLILPSILMEKQLYELKQSKVIHTTTKNHATTTTANTQTQQINSSNSKNDGSESRQQGTTGVDTNDSLIYGIGQDR